MHSDPRWNYFFRGSGSLDLNFCTRAVSKYLTDSKMYLARVSSRGYSTGIALARDLALADSTRHLQLVPDTCSCSRFAFFDNSLQSCLTQMLTNKAKTYAHGKYTERRGGG